MFSFSFLYIYEKKNTFTNKFVGFNKEDTCVTLTVPGRFNNNHNTNVHVNDRSDRIYWLPLYTHLRVPQRSQNNNYPSLPFIPAPSEFKVIQCFKGSRSHLQRALSILKSGMNEECTILMTFINSQSFRL